LCCRLCCGLCCRLCCALCCRWVPRDGLAWPGCSNWSPLCPGPPAQASQKRDTPALPFPIRPDKTLLFSTQVSRRPPTRTQRRVATMAPKRHEVLNFHQAFTNRLLQPRWLRIPNVSHTRCRIKQLYQRATNETVPPSSPSPLDFNVD
jgi:hypothetical protein